MGLNQGLDAIEDNALKLAKSGYTSAGTASGSRAKKLFEIKRRCFATAILEVKMLLTGDDGVV